MNEGEEVRKGSSDHIVEFRRVASSWMQYPSSRLVYYKVTKLCLKDRFHRQIDMTTFTSWSGSRGSVVFHAIANVIVDGLLIRVDLSSQDIFLLRLTLLPILPKSPHICLRCFKIIILGEFTANGMLITPVPKLNIFF
ncbi:hypothetical protein GOBAR_DD28671 [Gossypium barbadense]|nr:hypothetical protein GOBAR_DD28671 [Gossypium barbadense]